MLAILWREIRLHYTKPYWLIANFVTPLFYLAFFGVLFSNAINTVTFHGSKFSYLHFFIPGLIAMQSFLSWSHTLALVNLDRRARVLEVISMSSTHLDEYFYGRLIGTQILVIIKTSVLLGFAVIFFNFPVRCVYSIIIFVLLLIISNCIWFNIGFILGFLIRTEDIRDIVMQLITLPLTFLSNIYYPVESLTGILRTIVYANPLTHATTVIRIVLLINGSIQISSIVILSIYFTITIILVYIGLHKFCARLE
jgi:ABC-2 type transport system permease protein